MPRKRISVIGDGTCCEQTAHKAYELGRLIAEAGYDLVCGGLGGVMEAACKGAKQAGGTTIGILPGTDIHSANEFVEIPIVTGLTHMRNFLVVANSAACVAVEGKWGTLSELALAGKIGKPVVAIGKFSKIEGVIPVDSAESAVEALKNILKK